MKTDTIAAIATALSNSGIGIIRVSGEDAIGIVNNIYRTKKGKKALLDYESHTIHYGFIYDRQEMIDEVMVSVMKAPKSYTTENTVEINCHGGVLVMKRILEIVLKNGARAAEPGEFTKRAFLYGRLDLSKAEAVMDMIHSKNEFALKASANQLKGSVFQMIKKLREEIIYEIAFIESALDDPEHISLEGYYEKLEVKIKDMIQYLGHLISSADNGKMLKEGIHTVIVGKPNVGKSSLLNVLMGEERAIVTDIAGTTRDILEETIKLHGITLNMIDTAGIHSTDDKVEKIGVEKAKKYAKDADLIVYIVDASVELDESDEEIIKMTANKKSIVLLNKSDLQSVITEDYLKNKIEEVTRKIDNSKLNCAQFNKKDLCIIKTSTKENIGIDIFEKAIKEMFFHGEISFNDEVIITNLRHKQLLSDAYHSLKMVEKSICACMPEDFLTIDFMSAYTSLGYIIGEEVEEDLVNEIFAKFCMGK